MITARELAEKIGQSADFLTNGIAVRVVVRDARVRFGEVDYLIAPVAGYGDKWVAHYRLKDFQAGKGS